MLVAKKAPLRANDGLQGPSLECESLLDEEGGPADDPSKRLFLDFMKSDPFELIR